MPRLIDALRSDFEKFVLDALGGDLIKRASINPATFQRIFAQTEVVVRKIIDAGLAHRLIANNWSRDSAK
jgi:hypothetical protein